MTTQTTYGDISPRTAGYAVKTFLERAAPYLVFEKFGQSDTLPAHKTKTMKWRRFNALPNTPKALVEGVTPTGTKLTTTDITLTLTQYGDYTEITDVVADTHEDPVLQEAQDVLSQQAAEMIEKVRFGVLKGCANVFYAGAAATVASRNLVIGTLAGDNGRAHQRRVVRALARQNAKTITKIVRSTPNYQTENVAPAYVAICHPDLEKDIRDMSGFVPAEKYGQISPWENEVGKCENVRYVTSTLCEPYLAAGAAVSNTLGVTNSDVYPVIYLGQNAYGIVALKGMFAAAIMVRNPKPEASDPLAQRGSVGWKTMQGAVVLNDAWMVVLEVAAST